MIRVFKNDYDISEFYSLMGKFFAERTYKKELPYMYNAPELIWYLNIDDANGNIKAFSAIKEGKGKTEFVTDYYIDDIQYLVEITEEKLSQQKSNNPIYTATSNNEIKEMFFKFGFSQYKETTNYYYLMRSGKND